MNKFFVTDEIYKDRIAICKECVYYSKTLGQCKRCLCFMKIKARIGGQECPQKFWAKTTEMKAPDDLPQEIIDEILDLLKPTIQSTILTMEQEQVAALVYQLALME